MVTQWLNEHKIKHTSNYILNILYINIWIYKWYKIKITCTEIIDNEKDEKTFENN